MSVMIALKADQTSWQRSYRCANTLLKDGAEIYWTTEPFVATDVSGHTKQFGRGTFLITTLPPGLDSGRAQILWENMGVEPIMLDAVEDFVGLSLKAPRIAMYGGGGAPYNHAVIFAELGFDVEFITPQEVIQGKLADFDVFGMPGGGGIAMKGQLDPLGDDGCAKIRDFVQQGGMYMGSCAGAFDAALVSDSFLAVCPQQRRMQLVNANIWNSNDTEWVGLNSPGVGVLESRNLRPDHPVMFGLPDRFRITHYNGPFFESQPNALPEASNAIGLAAVTDFTEAFTPAEYFLSHAEYNRPGAEETTLIGQAARESRWNIVAGYNGAGRVVLFGSHPEFGYNLGMDQWSIPAQMVANAAFWQAGHIAAPRSLRRKAAVGTPRSYPLGSGLKRIADRLDTITSVVDELAERDYHNATWLAADHAMSTFGLSGAEIWQQNVASFGDVAVRIKETIALTEAAAREATSLIERLRGAAPNGNGRLADALEDALLGLEEAIHYRTPREWNQDFGYEGVLQMLERTEEMVSKAEINLSRAFEPSPNPYQYFDSSPYQLVVGSYLSAAGVFTNALFLLRIHQCRLEEWVFRAQSAI